MRRALALGVCFASAGMAAGLMAQAPAGGPPMGGGGPHARPLEIHQLTPSVYWAEGGVGNVGFIVGDKGVIVIDATMFDKSGKELLDDIAKITPNPVNAVVLTHSDSDHVNGLTAFPAGVQIYAQENTTKRMKADVDAGKSPVPVDKLPNHSVDKREVLTIDGVKLELLHWAPAHTDGDLVIYVPEQKVVFTGDIFAFDQPRAKIHLDQDGSSEGWITSAKAVVALNADQFVVGHGAEQTKQSLEERVKLVETEREQIVKLVGEGKSLAEIEAAVGDPPPGGPKGSPFSGAVYQELTEKK